MISIMVSIMSSIPNGDHDVMIYRICSLHNSIMRFGYESVTGGSPTDEPEALSMRFSVAPFQRVLLNESGLIETPSMRSLQEHLFQ